MTDRRIAALTGTTEDEVRARAPRRRHPPGLQARRHLRRRVRGAHAVHVLDVRGRVRGARRPTRRKVMILGGGPNRIGQGIEFDYCCVHAAMALREEGFESIMVNCNPETVSTDYDTSDRLYFEPLTLEDVLEICDVEKPWGVIVQFGGQTPLKLAVPLAARRRADPRHERRRDRPRRGPRAVRRGDDRSSASTRRAGASRAALDEARARRRTRSASR